MKTSPATTPWKSIALNCKTWNTPRFEAYAKVMIPFDDKYESDDETYANTEGDRWGVDITNSEGEE